jgi:hypothetical protein
MSMSYHRIPRELHGEVIACLQFALPVQVVEKFKRKASPATLYAWIAECRDWSEEDWQQVEQFRAKASRRMWR